MTFNEPTLFAILSFLCATLEYSCNLYSICFKASSCPGWDPPVKVFSLDKVFSCNDTVFPSCDEELVGSRRVTSDFTCEAAESIPDRSCTASEWSSAMEMVSSGGNIFYGKGDVKKLNIDSNYTPRVVEPINFIVTSVWGTHTSSIRANRYKPKLQLPFHPTRALDGWNGGCDFSL